MVDEARRRDPPPGPDAYELAVLRGASGQDPDDGPRGADRPPAAALAPRTASDDDGPPPLPRLQAGPFRVGPTGLLVGVVALVAVGSLVRFGGSDLPEPAPSCTSYGLALSSTRVHPGGLVRYSAVGPSGPVTLLVSGPDGTVAAAEQTLPGTRLDGCGAVGRFGVQVAPGEHTVLLVRNGRPVVVQRITVTEVGDPSAG